MTQIKVFDTSYDSVINDWLKENDGIKVLDIKRREIFIEYPNGTNLDYLETLIIYETKEME